MKTGKFKKKKKIKAVANQTSKLRSSTPEIPSLKRSRHGFAHLTASWARRHAFRWLPVDTVANSTHSHFLGFAARRSLAFLHSQNASHSELSSFTTWTGTRAPFTPFLHKTVLVLRHLHLLLLKHHCLFLSHTRAHIGLNRMRAEEVSRFGCRSCLIDVLAIALTLFVGSEIVGAASASAVNEIQAYASLAIVIVSWEVSPTRSIIAR